MTCTCKECGRKYTYDDEVGYSKDLCGPYCDGRHRRTAEIARLRALLGEARIIVQAYGLMAMSARRHEQAQEAVDLQGRIAKELEVTK